MLGNATEAQAERAIATLKRAIEAAENSNQAGENFVVGAANWEPLHDALIGIAEYWNRDQNHDAMANALWAIIDIAERATAQVGAA